MATEKKITSRVIHKHDVEANWVKATTFIPKQGELIVYDIDENYIFERFKIGDGKTLVSNLPFYFEDEIEAIWAALNKKIEVELNGQILVFSHNL